MILIDTNIWAYYFDSTLPEHTQVIKPVEDALRQSKGAVSSTVVIETMHYLVRRLGSLVGGEKGQVFLNYGIPIYLLDAEALELTLQRLCELSHLGIGGRDASILATMAQNNLVEIMTHDQAFKRVPDIKVIDPIKK